MEKGPDSESVDAREKFTAVSRKLHTIDSKLQSVDAREKYFAVSRKLHTIDNKLRSLQYRFDSQTKKKMRSIEKYRSSVEALQSQMDKEKEKENSACASVEETHHRRASLDEKVAWLKLQQKLAEKQFDFDMMEKKYEMKVIRQCFLQKHFRFQRRIHSAYILTDSDMSSSTESDSSSSSDSDILEERAPKRAKKELEAGGPQNAENISPPLEDAAATQSPASLSPGNVAVCGGQV